MLRKALLVVATLGLVIGGAVLYISLTQTPSVTASQRVLIAVADIPPGTEATRLTGAHVEVRDVPRGGVPANAITNPASIANQKTLLTVFEGQVLTDRHFGDVSATGGLPIPAGHNAISVEMTEPARVAGFVQPGSKVVVYARSGASARVVLPAADVIAVGKTTTTGKSSSGSSSKDAGTIVTFALNPRDSQTLITEMSNGLYLGLLPE